jgi:anhydro-N-acetylmuramic acid kinase
VKGSIVRIKGTGPGLAVKHVDSLVAPFSPGLRSRLLAPRMDAREVGVLNVEVGERISELALKLCDHATKTGIDLDFIASSGLVFSHVPPRSESAVGTLTLGDPAVIAERTGHPVVSHFRARDVAAGGQGVPLEAYGYWSLFRRPDRTVVVLDLGGTATITVVPPNMDETLAFETGPACSMLDGTMRLLTAGTQDMDKNGKLAAKGVVVDEFLEYLLDHPYFQRVPPKSASAGEFDPETYLRDALASRKEHGMEDLLTTCTAAVAYGVMRAYNRFVDPRFDVSRLIVVGGGSANKALIGQVRKALPDVATRTSDEYKLPVLSVGSIAAAILGNETICMTPANMPQATGARRPAVLGSITPG